MKQRTKDQALKIIDNMIPMIEEERVRGGDYVFEIDAPDRTDAICGGRKHCLLGTAWVAAGQKYLHTAGYWRASLVGVHEHERDEFLSRRPGLKLVYDELNNAALRMIRRRPGWKATYEETQRENEEDNTNYAYGGFDSAAEGLFEIERLDKRDLLRLVRSTRSAIEKIEVEA